VQGTGFTLYACLTLHRRAAGWPRTHWYLFRSERSPEGLSLDRIHSKVQSVQPGEPFCKPRAFKLGFLTLSVRLSQSERAASTFARLRFTARKCLSFIV